ncbi:MAG: DM13 domain-containing protein [Anaerolineae bacterium]|nr:DM13 domain-containing protein [Anaerolineae bacterium]
MLKVTPTMAVAMARAATSPDVVVPTEEQGMPALTNPSVVAGGTFTEIDALHTAKGTVILYQLPDNSRLLRLEDFSVTNGPELHVYLVRNPKPRKPEEVGNDYIDLGALKGNVGNQNFPVPSETDLNAYQGIIIYSVPFSVIFSSAQLRLS